ncbi:MAG: RNA polymerase sigma-70 factor [Pseudomonadota bacterium]
MDARTRTFENARKRLQGIAYRMLGSAGEAEEVVQDVWLRWDAANDDDIASAEAWLVSTTTRLSIDHLRAAKVRREHYTGYWLPEPLLADGPATPEDILERADDISVAFLMLLERLAPDARAAYLMREVFDADYSEVARVTGKSEAACRQMVHRARAQLTEGRPRRKVPPQDHYRLMRAFADAMDSGDLAAMASMMDEDATLIGDGGGIVPSFGKPLEGARRIAQLFYASHRRFGKGVRVELAVFNGQWGLLRFIGGELESAQSYETDGERIVRIHVQRNPEKLARIRQALGYF